jgi:peptide/nickel transport system substrate-binding protein
VDFIQDVPVQDLERVSEAEGIGLATAPQNRVIFFGMNVGADDLTQRQRGGRQPARRCARAPGDVDMAINRDASSRS